MQTTHSITSNHGESFLVRPWQQEDYKLLVRLFEHLGDKSRKHRFNLDLHQADPEFITLEAKKMASLCAPKGEGWLVLKTGQNQEEIPVAGGQLVLDHETNAEMGLSVSDEYQNQGLGGQLILFLIDRAKRLGVKKVTALIYAYNDALLHLVRHSPYPIKEVISHSEIFLEADLTQFKPDSKKTI